MILNQTMPHFNQVPQSLEHVGMSADFKFHLQNLKSVLDNS